MQNRVRSIHLLGSDDRDQLEIILDTDFKLFKKKLTDKNYKHVKVVLRNNNQLYLQNIAINS